MKEEIKKYCYGCGKAIEADVIVLTTATYETLLEELFYLRKKLRE